jgi:hypothetical protein
MRGVELRGGRASRQSSMALVGERGQRTWHGQRVEEVVVRAPARVGEGRGKGINSRWAGLAGWSLHGLGRRPLGQKAEQASGVAGPTGSELKRNSF